jgi:hypothetical protein
LTAPLAAGTTGAMTRAGSLLLATAALGATTALAEPDHIVARTVVPDASRRVGEVRLVQRGGATIVQTLLQTKLLRRVVAEIRDKEQANWPAERTEHPDMLRYVHALEQTSERLASARSPEGDRRLRLGIEFAATRSTASVVIATFASDGGDEIGDVDAWHPIEALDLRRSYVLANMRLILADAFGLPLAELHRLGSLGLLAEPTQP